MNGTCPIPSSFCIQFLLTGSFRVWKNSARASRAFGLLNYITTSFILIRKVLHYRFCTPFPSFDLPVKGNSTPLILRVRMWYWQSTNNSAISTLKLPFEALTTLDVA